VTFDAKVMGRKLKTCATSVPAWFTPRLQSGLAYLNHLPPTSHSNSYNWV